MRFDGPGKRTLELVFCFVDHLSTAKIPLLGVRGQSAFWGAWKTHPASLLFVLGYVDYIIDENSMLIVCRAATTGVDLHVVAARATMLPH